MERATVSPLIRGDRRVAEKKTEKVYVWIPESMELELRRLADEDGRKLSDYIGHVLRRFLYGHASRVVDTTSSGQEND